MALVAAAVFFGIYIANVLGGALAGAQFLGDVGEALMLFVASLFFVAAILKREAAANTIIKDNNPKGGNNGS